MGERSMGTRHYRAPGPLRTRVMKGRTPGDGLMERGERMDGRAEEEIINVADSRA